MKTLRKFLSLTAGDRRLLLTAAVWLAGVRLALVLVSFRTLREFVAGMARRPGRSPGAGVPLPDRIAWAVMAASRYVPRAGTCLIQALAAHALLLRQGYSANLRIGVARGNEGRLEGHAWVESQGRVVIGGSELGRYTCLSVLE